ncbi:MAG TPA: hypothetical protein VL283_00770, partial [Candidatus Baltobacteraceae bacterium]|nr:hypothetical protein [Candidatus Baltobacteraceae bacterium]
MDSPEKRRAHGVEAYLTNRIGHATGRGIAKALWHQRWFSQLAAGNPELTKLLSEGLVALTSLFELGGDHPIVRLANFVTESVALENLELLEQFEKNPDDPELAKKVEQKIGEAIGKTEANVIVALEHIHRDDQCALVVQYVKDATPAAFAGKDGKARSNPTAARLYPMTLTRALDANKPLCGLCYPALSVRKAEDPQKPKEVVSGRNFAEFLMRYRAENPTNPKFEKFWKTNLSRLDGPDGPELARKFQAAFNGKHSYEAFCFVADLPHRNPETGREEWHHALDALLGQVTPPDSLKKKIEGFIDEEKR